MKPPSTGMIVGVVGVAAVVLAAVSRPGDRTPVTRTSEPAPQTQVSANGFTLVSTSVTFPADDASLPDGPNVALVVETCTACHSASMMTTQPALSADQWKATVTKMRDVYKARVPDGDVAAIVTYLTALPGQRAASSAVNLRDSKPKPPG